MQWADAFRGDWQIYPGSGYVVALRIPADRRLWAEVYRGDIRRLGRTGFEDLMKVTDALERLPYVDGRADGSHGLVLWRLYDELFEGTLRDSKPSLHDGIVQSQRLLRRNGGTLVPEWDLKGHRGTPSL